MHFDYAHFNATFSWFFPTVAGLFGAIIGSFLNVCIVRIPAGESVVSPPSHCGCGAAIRWYDNVPVLSWLLLRGRARCCGRRFSARYAFVEALTIAVFVACWTLFPPQKAIAGMVLASALICATCIDLAVFEIPDRFSVGLGVVGLFGSIAFPAIHGQAHEIWIVASVRSAAIALVGMLAGAGLVMWIAVTSYTVMKKDTLGMGDVKLVGAIGAFTGWQGSVTAIFLGSMLGVLWFAGVTAYQKLSGKPVLVKGVEPGDQAQQVGLQTYVPFGPMLATAGFLHFLILHRIVDPQVADFIQTFGL